MALAEPNNPYTVSPEYFQLGGGEPLAAAPTPLSVFPMAHSSPSRQSASLPSQPPHKRLSKMHLELLHLYTLAQRIRETTHGQNWRPLQALKFLDECLQALFLARPSWSPEEFLQLSQAFRCVYSAWIYCWTEGSDMKERVRESEVQLSNDRATSGDLSGLDPEALRNFTPQPTLLDPLPGSQPVERSLAAEALRVLANFWGGLFQPTPSAETVPAKLRVLPAPSLDSSNNNSSISTKPIITSNKPPDAITIDMPFSSLLSPSSHVSSSASADETSVDERLLRLKKIIAHSLNVGDPLAPDALWALFVEDYVWQSDTFLPAVVKHSRSWLTVDIIQRLTAQSLHEPHRIQFSMLATGVCSVLNCPHLIHDEEFGRFSVALNPQAADVPVVVAADTNRLLDEALSTFIPLLHLRSLTGAKKAMTGYRGAPHFTSELALLHQLGWLSAVSSRLPENISIGIKADLPTGAVPKLAPSSYRWQIKSDRHESCTSIIMPSRHLSLIIAFASAVAKELLQLEQVYSERLAVSPGEQSQGNFRFKAEHCNAWEQLSPLKRPLGVVEGNHAVGDPGDLAQDFIEAINTKRLSLSSLDQIHLRNILVCYLACPEMHEEQVERRKLVVCSPGCKKHKDQVENRWPEAAHYLNHYPFLAVSMLRLMILPFGSLELTEPQGEARQWADSIAYPAVSTARTGPYSFTTDLAAGTRHFGGDLVHTHSQPIRFYVK